MVFPPLCVTLPVYSGLGILDLITGDALLFRLLNCEECGWGEPVSRASGQDRLKAQIWAPEVFQVQMRAHITL